jgi:pimeloyl-ACP methyl ester carboxylesterase/DNA-binding winged helix-turn-helix (wHTH) protein
MLVSFNDFKLNSETFELTKSGRAIAVEPQVFDLLVMLIENRDRILTRDEILDRVWNGRIVSDAALSSRIKAARQAIGDDGTAQRLIRTIHGRGFRFVGLLDEDITTVTGSETSSGEPRAPRQIVKYCRTSDDVKLAYAICGQGPPLVKAANWLSHVEYEWESPVWRHWWRDLSHDNLLIRYDERGNGLSDWAVDDLGYQTFVRDLEAVVDAAGVDRFPLLGLSQGCATCIDFAVRHPERVTCLILYGGYAAGWQARGNAEEIARRKAMVELTRMGWGQDNPAFRQIFTSLFVPSATPMQMAWFNELARLTTSPENAARLQVSCSLIDVRSLLEKVQVPTLVLHVRNDAVVPLEAGRQLAAGIPDARLVLLEGENHIILEEDACWPRFLSEVGDFIKEHSPRAPR